MNLGAILASDTQMTRDIYSLCTIAAIAAAVPLLVGLLRLPVAEVVLLLGAGIVFGPSLLGWIQVSDSISLLSNIGLAFLFFAAGLEIESRAVRGESGRLALIGWLAAVVLAASCAFILERRGIIHDFLGVTIALTSTALGTLLPVLRDKGLLRTKLGTYFLGAGAFGEFGPVLAVSILLSTKSPFFAIISVLVFTGVALLFAEIPEKLRSRRIGELLERGHHSSAQTAVRLTVLLLVGLLASAEFFGLDLVLGAFVAGIIARHFLPKDEDSTIMSKLTGLAFGIFIPLFFVISGANLDVNSILANPLLLLLFFALILFVRGVPQFFIYRKALPNTRERARFSLYVATALPIIVAVTNIEVGDGVMLPSVGAALVGAGALSVLVFPFVAQLLEPRKNDQEEARVEATA